MKTENRFYKEPTHDEIALSAFLAWERDGRPDGLDLHYWIQAESVLRTQREKQAAQAAAQAAKPWPPQAGVPAAKQPKTRPAAAKASLTTTARRNEPVTMASPELPKSRTSARPVTTVRSAKSAR